MLNKIFSKNQELILKKYFFRGNLLSVKILYKDSPVGKVSFNEKGGNAAYAEKMEKIKVVYTDNIYKDTQIEECRFGKAGYTFQIAPAHDEDALVEACRDADAVMVSFAEMTGRIIEAMERCRVIVRCGMGFNNVDIPAATRKGIMVANVQKYCLDEVSDHVLALTLTLLRRTAYMSRLLREGIWAPAKARPIPRIRGLTFGLYGLGGISSLVAGKAKPFGFRVVSYDPFLPDAYPHLSHGLLEHYLHEQGPLEFPACRVSGAVHGADAGSCRKAV